MNKSQNKKGVVVLLVLCFAMAVCAAAALNMLFIGGFISSRFVWLGLALVAAASVAINVASVSKRKRKDEDNIATISKPFAVCLVSVAMLWVLTLIVAIVKL